MDDNLKNKIKQSAIEYKSAFANLESLEAKRIILERDLIKIEDDIAAYERDESASIETLNSIYSSLPKEDEIVFEKIIEPYLNDVNRMTVYGQ